MSEKEIRIMRQQIEKLRIKAHLKKTPTLKISNKGYLASVSLFRNVITVGEGLLSLWRNGKIGEDDVESTLAHEIGHIVERNRGLKSVWFRTLAIGVPYILLGVILPKIVSGLLVAEPWIPPIMTFIIWALFAPCVIRWAVFAAQFEADKIALGLIEDDQRFAESIVRKSRPYFAKGFGPIETWELLGHVILSPSLSERLRNINFEIKERSIEIQRIEKSS